MKDMKAELARRIAAGEPVALYCYGILASHLLAYLDHFYQVRPLAVIDNDPRKRGTAEFGIPVLPYAEARERFGALKYFICSNDFKFSIIGDLLERGERPEDIINYIPVEKRRGCLYFYDRKLLEQGMDGDEAQWICHCNSDSFKSKEAVLFTRVPPGASGGFDAGRALRQVTGEFESGNIDLCNTCVMNREQYLVKRGCSNYLKFLFISQYHCRDCLASCVYCCEGRNDGGKRGRCNSPEGFSSFLRSFLSLDLLSDDFNCAIVTSERNMEQKTAAAVNALELAGQVPMVYTINSCLMTYSPTVEKLLRRGMLYVIWSLDAGTRETYRNIKQIDAFDRVIEHARRYIAADIFAGRFFVAKYLIVKGANDNAAEFDAFLALVQSFGLSYVALSYDFYAKADENDLEFIRQCYGKLTERGLRLTYSNDSEQVTKALRMNSLGTIGRPAKER